MSGETKDKHTPGPWFSMSAITDPENVDGLREDDGAILVTQDKADDYESDIAYAIGRHVSAPNRTNEEIEANARLIAAAPSMLSALEQAAELIRVARDHFPKRIRDRDKFHLEVTCAEVCRAIGKAKGDI